MVPSRLVLDSLRFLESFGFSFFVNFLELYLDMKKQTIAWRVGATIKGLKTSLQHLEIPQNMSIEVLRCSVM